MPEKPELPRAGAGSATGDSMIGISGFGLLVFIFLAWAIGRGGRAVNLRVLGWGLGLQLTLGFVVFRTGTGHSGLLLVNDFVTAVVEACATGPRFLMGSLADAAATSRAGLGFLLFFQGLLSIIVISVLLQLLYQCGIMGRVVRAFAVVFTRLMRVSGAEALAASANILVGNESILSVRPFLARMTASELCVLMTACMATVSANMMGAYVAILGPTFPGIAGHLASASLLSAPAALLAAKLAWPETGQPETLGLNVSPHVERAPGLVSAVMTGAENGGRLLLGICLLLVAVVGLLGVADLALAWAGGWINALTGGTFSWSISSVLGVAFRPFAWLMGVPWSETAEVGQLLGIRAVTTEIGAYTALSAMLEAGTLSPRTAAIAAYSLCGFAHIPAVGITAGGVAALVPGRRDELAAIAPRAFLAATLACLMTGCIAGIFAPDVPELLLGG